MTRGTRHEQALAISSQLTQTFRRMYQREAAMITPEEVIEVLNQVGAHFVLMGTHGIGGWRSQARATQDVDVLVSKRDFSKAVKALKRAYPNLAVRDFRVVTRFIDPATDQPVIDLMKPEQEVYKMVFKHAVWVGTSHRIPTLEMALVSKFAAMTSPNRDQDKKLTDGADFVNIAKTNGAAIDRIKLRRLANKVYPDGGAEIIQLVDDVLAGRRIQF